VANLREQFTAAPVEIAEMLIDRTTAGEPAFVERAPEAEDVAAFEFLLLETQVARLDFRKCVPLPHRRDTATHYVILTSRDAGSLDRLLSLYPDSAVTRDVDLWQETAATVTVPAGAELAPPPHQPVARCVGHRVIWIRLVGDTLVPGQTLSDPAGTRKGMFLAIWPSRIWERGSMALPIGQRDGPVRRPLPAVAARRAIGLFAITLPENARPVTIRSPSAGTASPLERLPLLAADSPLPDQRAIIGTIRVTTP
jgi:hypothetical protein